MGNVVSPNSFKKLMDFSSGVVNHVKSFYNPSLGETKMSNQNADATPKSKPDIVSDDADPEPSKTSLNNDHDHIEVVNPDNNNDSDKKIDVEPEKKPEIAETEISDTQ